MRLPILFIALISMVLAQQQPRNAQRAARNPQGQLRYQDPSGLKVDWKFFSPQNQLRSQLDQSQRSERGYSQPIRPQQVAYQQPEPQLVQANQQQQAHPDPNQLQYRAYQVQALEQQQQQVEPNQAQYQAYQAQAAGHPQADSSQEQYKAYQAQAAAQPQVDSNQVQYKAYQVQAAAQPQVESNQEQYNAIQVQAAAQPQVDSNQVQYKAYQVQPAAQPQPEINQIQYKSISEAPSHVKQLLINNFKSQRPYVDPSAFLYTSNLATPQQSASAEFPRYEQPSESYEQAEQQKSRRDYADRGLQGRIVYKNEYEQEEQLQQQLQQQQQQQLQQQQQQVEHLPAPVERVPVPLPQKLFLDKNMPPEIRQLLQYQAQIPYDVIANSISYKPKALFVPKPLPEDAKGAYNYRSQVYYVNNDQFESEYDSQKPVQEDQRH